MHFIAMLLVAIVAAWPVASVACTPIRFEPQSYGRGDLFTQYALRADTIQIARAHHRRVLTTDYYRNEVSLFDFRVLETLAALPFSANSEAFSLRAYSALDRVGGGIALGSVNGPFYFDQALTHTQYEFGIEALTNNAYYCRTSPYIIHEGDVFVVLRRRDGSLYQLSHDDMFGRALALEVDGGLASSLVRIRGLDDPALNLLRERLTELRADRERLERSAIFATFGFGRVEPAVTDAAKDDSERK